jgi:Transcriptional regulator
MTYQQLRYAIEVAERGSFSEAAERCLVTQPTLSQQVAKLEEELGVQVFARDQKPVRATALGARILEEARLSYAGIARIEALVAEELGKTDGELRLGLIPTLGPYLLPELVSGLKGRFPELRLDLREELTEQMLQDLRRGSLDLGLCAGPVDCRGLERAELFEDEFVAFLGTGDSLLSKGEIRVEDLDRRGLLLLAEGHCFRDQVLSFCPKDPGDEGLRLRSGSFETLCNLVDAGQGYTLLPSLAIPGLSKERLGRVRRFAAPRPSRRIILLAQEGYPRRRIMEAVVDAVRNV